ncbi:MAG: DUF4426 domain-containing protein [Pseudomonadales bacterium]
MSKGLLVYFLRLLRSGGLTTLLFLCVAGAHADQFVSRAGYEIHYSTFSSMIIPSDVAQSHDIIRSKERIVTNISVQRDGTSVKATISGTTTNLLEQSLAMTFTEVTEQDATYYLANQRINERDAIRFRIRIQPLDSSQAFDLEFTRQYY